MEVHQAQTRRRWRPGRRWLIAVILFCACTIATGWWLATRNALPCVGVYEIGKWENPLGWGFIYKLRNGIICSNINCPNGTPALISMHDWDGKLRWRVTIPTGDLLEGEWDGRSYNLSEDGHWLAAVIAKGEQAHLLRWYDGRPFQTVTLPLHKDNGGFDFRYIIWPRIFDDGRVFVTNTDFPDNSIAFIEGNQVTMGRYRSRIPLVKTYISMRSISQQYGENDYKLEITAEQDASETMKAKEYHETVKIKISGSHLIIMPVSITVKSTTTPSYSPPTWSTSEENERYQLQESLPFGSDESLRRVREKSSGKTWKVLTSDRYALRRFLRKDGSVISLEMPRVNDRYEDLRELLSRIPAIRKKLERQSRFWSMRVTHYQQQEPPRILGTLKIMSEPNPDFTHHRDYLLHKRKRYIINQYDVSPEGRYLYITAFSVDYGNCYLLVYQLSKSR